MDDAGGSLLHGAEVVLEGSGLAEHAILDLEAKIRTLKEQVE